ncbi:MAG: hypothetical protein JST00_25240 [Deltaproteobacteria bacterium]|nr:hypothetical protein [Deltaproteobacteria bacterium]
MSGRHRGFMVMSVLAVGLGLLAACADDHRRCGRGHGRGHPGALDDDDDASITSDAGASEDVSRIPADAQVGDPSADGGDSDADSADAADAGGD